jgi:hyaluronan synthase
VLVTVYCLARFALAPFYRPTPDVGYRPSASIVVPAFNEEEIVGHTIDALYSSDYPAELLEVVVVDDGSTDGTWEQILAATRPFPDGASGSRPAVLRRHRGPRAGQGRRSVAAARR